MTTQELIQRFKDIDKAKQSLEIEHLLRQATRALEKLYEENKQLKAELKKWENMSLEDLVEMLGGM